ncbi:MAG: zinc ribbon domain-containing protein, partial [Nitrososphaerota archaeon]
AFFRPRLTGFVGNIGTLEHRNGAIRVVVDRPIRVEAVYVTEPDLVNIGLLAAVIAGSGFLLLYRPSRKGRSKPRTGSMEKQEEDQVLRIRLCSKGHEVPADANVCPECGEILSPAVSQSP